MMPDDAFARALREMQEHEALRRRLAEPAGEVRRYMELMSARNDPLRSVRASVTESVGTSVAAAFADPTRGLSRTLSRDLLHSPAHEALAALREAAVERERMLDWQRATGLPTGLSARVAVGVAAAALSGDVARRLGETARAAEAASAHFRRLRDEGASVREAAERILGGTRAWESRLTSVEARFLAGAAASVSAGTTALDRQLLGLAVTTHHDAVRRGLGYADSWQAAGVSASVAAQFLAPAEAFGRYAPAALARASRAAEAADASGRAAAETGLLLAQTQVAAGAALQAELYGEASGDVLEGAQDEDSTPEATDVPAATRRAPVATPGAPESAPLSGASGAAAGRILRFFVGQGVVVQAHASVLVAPDGRALADVVAPARRSERQRALARLVNVCNRDAESHHGGDAQPFLVTGDVAAFFVEVGMIDAGTRAGVGGLVDGLYFTVYEASENKRRLHAYLPDAECAAVDRVYRVRNRLFRHNRDRLPRDAADRQARATLADLQALGLDGEPYAAADYERLHDGLLDEAIAFLEALRDRIRRGPPRRMPGRR